RYSQFIGDLVQSTQQRGRHRNAKAGPPEARFMAAFAGYPDAIHAGHPLAVAEIAHQRIDASLEDGDVAEGRDVDRSNRLSGVGDAVVVMIEVDNVAAHRGAAERACEQADDHRKAVALVP